MNRRVLHRVILSFVCALSLALIPMSYSWAQSSTTGNQQDQTQTDRNADQQNQDVNQDTNQRQKPASEPNNMQDKSQTQSQTEQQTGKSREGLPATAGELPLLALIGVLSLAAAGSTRLFARAKSTR